MKTVNGIMSAMPPQVYAGRQYDPTRTLTLRTKIASETKRRFKSLNRIVRKAIIQDGMLEDNSPGFFSRYDKTDIIRQFMEWLERQENRELLSGSGLNDKMWTDKYIDQAYKQGVKRARAEMIRAGYRVPPISADGGVEMIIVQPIHAEQSNVLGMAIRGDIQNTTTNINNMISRLLAGAVMEGRDKAVIADQISKILTGLVPDVSIPEINERFINGMRRTATISRTGIVKAHHVATIQEYQNWGVEGVVVMAEWVTAGDERVCQECHELSKHGLYTLEEIMPLIPVHYGCRCIALPVRRKR